MVVQGDPSMTAGHRRRVTVQIRAGQKVLGDGASLVAQWLRIRLPMQETQVRALVQEEPTCHGATKPVHHNY